MADKSDRGFVVSETERLILGVLMRNPKWRGEILQKYPSRLETFFSSPQAIILLRVVMGYSGQAYPSQIDPLVPELHDTEWSPLKVWDTVATSSVLHFWENVEHLRRYAKKRELRSILQEQLKALPAHENVDLLTSETSAKLSNLAADSSTAYDPSMKAAFSRYEEDKEHGRLGRRIPTLIPLFDKGLGGGLRVDPGELVVLSGREKQRKTTLLLNIVAAWHTQGLDGATVWICNEQSMNTSDLIGHLWALEATREAFKRGLTYTAATGGRKPWTFSKDQILEFHKDQDNYHGELLEVTQVARALVESWNIRFYCAAVNNGNAMDAESVFALARTDVEYKGAKRVVVDNLQGFRKSDESDYEVMNRVVPMVDAFPGTYGCLTIALSQLSRTKAEWSGGNQIKGGGGLEGRANLIIETSYDDEKATGIMGVKRTWGRNRLFFNYDLAIEPNSGLIIDGQDYDPKIANFKAQQGKMSV